MRAEHTEANRLPAVLLTHSSGASALIYVYAAHLASWKCGGEEQLYVSSAAEYGGGKAIRGGVPICWPQFGGRGEYPKHGFVRNSAKWKVLRTSIDPFPCVVLELCDDDETRAVFPPAFKLQYSVSLDGPNSVSTALAVINTGPEPLKFTTALHTYFKVSDVGGIAIHGLGGCQYEDSTKGGEVFTQPEDAPLSISGEVDRVYLSTPAEAFIVDGRRAIRILKMGFPDAVVWNIGAAAAGGMKDMGKDEWKQYVCYEAAVIGSPTVVPPTHSWTAGQTFTRIEASEVPKTAK